ncbi:MAG: GNAT family N-acetyltransferase [Victivallaceae bacterium]|nr:GNAT family N-acetyltransferase [Victivallaceae bacterium]
MEVRHAKEQDIEGILKLYCSFTGFEMPVMDEKLMKHWRTILSTPDHHVLVAEEDGKPVSTCVVVIIPNLTHGQQPYAFIENVATDPDYRNRGFGTAVLNHAREIAEAANCFKIMLMTGSKRDSVLNFYEHAGYNRHDKTGFIRWL